MKNIKNNNAITLIALVITIVVLLILAGISIGVLTGENGLINNAAKAKKEDLISQEKEIIGQASVIAMGYNKSGMLDEDEFETELKKLANADVTGVSEGKIIVLFNDTQNQYSVTQNGEVKEYTPPVTIATKRQESISNGTVSALSDTETITIEDDFENEIKVPKGFGIATDSGTKVEDGIVIEDADSSRQTYGSQFVWVPTGTIYTNTEKTTTKTITFGRYSFNTSNGVATALSGNEYTEDTASNHDSSFDTEIAKDIQGFLNSVNNNKGYYIARYEAGKSGISGNDKPQSKAGLSVFKSVTQQSSSTKCKNMYNSTSDGVTSDLMNSYAWDTALIFIQKCGKYGVDSSKYPIQRGYSAINTGGPQIAGNNKLKYEPGGTTERETPKIDVQCNIYDMAGNVAEWTTETHHHTSNPSVKRGSHYANSYHGPEVRGLYTKNSSSNEIGFRPILYL